MNKLRFWVTYLALWLALKAMPRGKFKIDFLTAIINVCKRHKGLPQIPESVSVRLELADGRTLREMMKNASPEIRALGDARLCWVNEGDLLIESMRLMAEKKDA